VLESYITCEAVQLIVLILTPIRHLNTVQSVYTIVERYEYLILDFRLQDQVPRCCGLRDRHRLPPQDRLQCAGNRLLPKPGITLIGSGMILRI
jgi:hypothetical protein